MAFVAIYLIAFLMSYGVDEQVAINYLEKPNIVEVEYNFSLGGNE